MIDDTALSLADVRSGLEEIARQTQATFGGLKDRQLSAIAPDVIQRFVEQHLDAVASVQSLDEREAVRAIMSSPFVSVIVYSVLDGWRLVVAHDRRHFEQARRVTLMPGFPR